MPTPVVIDEARRGSASVRWSRRVVSAAGVGAMVLSLSTHILPSRDEPQPTSGNSEVQNPMEPSDASPSTEATTPSPTASSTSPDPDESPEPSTATTDSPTTTAAAEEPDEPSETAKDKPGKGPTAPPGKPK